MSKTSHITPKTVARCTTDQAAIQQVLALHPSVILAILFGSLTSGQANSDSDLDLAVLSTTPLSSETRLQLIEELAMASGRPIDLIDLAQTHSPLLQQILTKGRLLVCTDRTRYANLLLQMVYEEADVMPYYRRILAERRQAWIAT